LQSPEITRLQDYLQAKKFTFAVGIHARPNQVDLIVSLPESVVGAKATKVTTSSHQLAILKTRIAQELGLNVQFVILRDPMQQKVEAGLNALLQARFSDQISAAFLSVQSEGKFDVWLEPTIGGIDCRPLLPKVNAAIAEYFRVVGAKIGTVRLVGLEGSTPSASIIMRETKRLAPVGADALKQSLTERGSIIPSVSWLESKLDTLRRRNMLVRLQSGEYVLTEGGLAVVPHGKQRHSSDVERALALGRAKW